MHKLAAATLALGLLAACSKPADTTNPPVAADQNRPTTAPQAGNNSFTEDQARGHLANAGYTDVSGMTQDANGVWHGQAKKDGKATPVTVDYQGSVTPK
jgi:putative membrane protein